MGSYLDTSIVPVCVRVDTTMTSDRTERVISGGYCKFVLVDPGRMADIAVKRFKKAHCPVVSQAISHDAKRWIVC